MFVDHRRARAPNLFFVDREPFKDDGRESENGDNHTCISVSLRETQHVEREVTGSQSTFQLTCMTLRWSFGLPMVLRICLTASLVLYSLSLAVIK